MKWWLQQKSSKVQPLLDEEVGRLREKEEGFLKLRVEIKEEIPRVLTEDVKKVLLLTDTLLGKMSEDLVDEFVHSKEFEIYKKVMKKVHRPLRRNKEGVEKLDKILTLYERKVITLDEARQMLGLPLRRKSQRQISKKGKIGVLETLKKQRYGKED